MSRRVLLIGATGVFGGRLAAMLSAFPDIELVLAARHPHDLMRLQAALRASGAAAPLSTQIFDRYRPGDLARIEPWVVVDAAGPFQDAGYDLALAAVRAGAHYVDLADARGFVAGFPDALDGAASAAGVLAVTGASSTPALSHAALEMLTAAWRKIDKVVVAISPGARAPRGLAVMQAILSYVGQPVRVFRGGGWRVSAGWSGLRRLDMPGVGRRWASLCETPDLDLLPHRFPIRGGALFLAGLELAPLHLGLSLLGWIVRWRLIGSLRPFARPLRGVANLLAPLGTDRGAMIVEAEGEDQTGRRIRARWSLWATANAGPSTPAAPAAALVRALIEGRAMQRGALACAGLLPLGDILRELAVVPIETRVDQGYPSDPVLFRRLLGPRFDALPITVQTIHGAATPATFRGHAVARAGRSPIARLLRRALDLPPSGRSAVEVQFEPGPRGEIWTRRFGAAQFTSRLYGTPRLGVFEEGFGPLRFVFEMHPTQRGVVWRMIGWRMAGLPLPLALAPRMHARADDVEGRYCFRVAVAHPVTGLLFAYRGELA